MKPRASQPPGRTIVAIVEADALARERLGALLAKAGHELAWYDDAEQYLASGADRAAACLIVDSVLPGLSGLELLKRLRRRGDVVPVMLLAAEADVPSVVAAMREGGTDVLEKPYAGPLFLRRLGQLIATAQHRQPH